MAVKKIKETNQESITIKKRTAVSKTPVEKKVVKKTVVKKEVKPVKK